MATILVIEDSRSALESIGLMLSEAGHQVIAFTCGKDAKQILVRQAVDAIITDIYMPDEDGLEVIKYARRNLPDIPIVAISGKTGRWDMLGVAKSLGAFCTLQKPFSKCALLEALATALSVHAGASPAPAGGADPQRRGPA